MLWFLVAVLVMTGLGQGLELIQSARSSVARADDPAGAGGVFHSLQARLVDTQNGTGVPCNTVGPVTAGQSNSYAVEGQVGVPVTGVSAVALSVLVINPSADGYLSVTADPAPTGSGTATALNWAAGETISNSALVAVGSNGHILLKAAVATNVVIDVEGYFAEGDGSPAAGGYVPVTPSRILNTINGTGAPQAQLASHATLTVQASGVAGVPSGASALFANIDVLLGGAFSGAAAIRPSVVATLPAWARMRSATKSEAADAPIGI